MIGIVGGIGPLAGLDLYKRIIDHTHAPLDQDHLTVLLASLSSEIADRNNFLLGYSDENPALGLAKVVLMLEKAGAKHIALACNTVHSPPIYSKLLELLNKEGFQAELIHLIDITLQTIKHHPANPKKVGLMVTSGAYKTQVYQTPLLAASLEPVLLPFDRHHELINQAIFEIKVAGTLISPQVVDRLNQSIKEMAELGAQAVILGCTEIGMVEKLLDFQGLPVFNPNTIMAQTLVERMAPEKLI